MSDEFDDLIEPIRSSDDARLFSAVEHLSDLPARMVSRLYRTAEQPLRSRLLACLLRPLGTLGLMGVAAGAFAGFLHRGGGSSGRAGVGDVARFSNEQMIELARFVEQVSPEVLQEFARLIAENPVGLAAFSGSVSLLLMQLLRAKRVNINIPPAEQADISGK